MERKQSLYLNSLPTNDEVVLAAIVSGDEAFLKDALMAREIGECLERSRKDSEQFQRDHRVTWKFLAGYEFTI